MRKPRTPTTWRLCTTRTPLPPPSRTLQQAPGLPVRREVAQGVPVRRAMTQGVRVRRAVARMGAVVWVPRQLLVALELSHHRVTAWERHRVVRVAWVVRKEGVPGRATTTKVTTQMVQGNNNMVQRGKLQLNQQPTTKVTTHMDMHTVGVGEVGVVGEVHRTGGRQAQVRVGSCRCWKRCWKRLGGIRARLSARWAT